MSKSSRSGSVTSADRNVMVAATQMCCSNVEENMKKAESLIRIANSRGAQVILLQELFQHKYFAMKEDVNKLQLAQETGITTFPTTSTTSSLLRGMCALAKELKVVIPISFYEKKNTHFFYSSVAMIDADGTILGISRRGHINRGINKSDGFYFTPSDSDFPVYKTKYGCFGIAVSTDQWYPEVARSLVLKGAEILFCPSALGTDPLDDSNNPKEHWQRLLQGHAAANMVPIVASNRVGTEELNGEQVTFCGSSFIAGPTGEMLKVADHQSEGVLVDTFDLDTLNYSRSSFGLLRDRRPCLYHGLGKMEG